MAQKVEIPYLRPMKYIILRWLQHKNKEEKPLCTTQKRDIRKLSYRMSYFLAGNTPPTLANLYIQ